MELLQQIAPDDPDSTLDTGWMERVTKQVAAETERLEFELKGYKNNLIKESIRVCHSIKPELWLLSLAEEVD